MICFVLLEGIRIQGPSILQGIGRVEIFYNGSWGSICDKDWDIKDARVVCRELGHLNAVKALQGGQVPSGYGKIWLEGVGCSGKEQNLGSCSPQKWGVHDCNHSKDAGVECTSTGEFFEILVTHPKNLCLKRRKLKWIVEKLDFISHYNII